MTTQTIIWHIIIWSLGAIYKKIFTVVVINPLVKLLLKFKKTRRALRKLQKFILYAMLVACLAGNEKSLLVDYLEQLSRQIDKALTA